MRKTIAAFWALFSTAMTIFGLPGIVDNWKAWNSLVAKCAPFMSETALKSTFLVVGLMSLTALLVWEIITRRKAIVGASNRQAATASRAWSWIGGLIGRKKKPATLAFSTDPAAVAKRKEQVNRVIAASENFKRIGQEETERPHLQRTIQALRSVADFNFADLAEAEFRARHEAQKAAETPQGKRAAAVKLGGLEGAKALIEIEIECIPTYPTDHETGEWDKWVPRMAVMLGQLLKPKFKREFLQCVKGITSPENARPTVIYHLRGMLVNLQEHDRRVTPTPIAEDSSATRILNSGLSIPRLQTAAAQIRQLGETICPYAIGAFVPGPARAPQDWRTETLAGLRAIVKESVCREYEKVIQDKSESAKNAARQFLFTLSETLTEFQLFD